MLFIINTGVVWGEAIVVASFLEQVGVEALPVIFILIALISIPAMAIYTAFTDRTPNEKLLIAILLIGAGGIIAGRVLIGLELNQVAYPFLYLLMFVPLSDIYALHWATYVNGMYDTRSAKRVTPVLVSSARVAGIVAGLSMVFINQLFAPASVLLIWAGALGLAALLVWLLPRLLREERAITEPSMATTAHISYLDNIREGYQYVSRSSFLGWMALSTFLLFLLLTLLNYQTSQILLDQLKTTAAIANFTAVLTGVVNIFTLPILLFGLSRLIGRVGLANTNLIYPAGTLAISGSLVVAPNLATAALAYLDQHAFMLALRNPTDSLLYNAVPVRVKGRARAFISGLVAPIGSLVGGILLLLPLITSAWFLPALIGLAALIYVASAVIIRKEYNAALIKMLEEEDYSFLLAQRGAEFTALDPAALKTLQQKLAESDSPEFTIFMAELIARLGGSAAAPILEKAAKTAPEAGLRAALIDVLTVAELPSAAVRPVYIGFLADPDGRVRQAAIAGLEQLAETEDGYLLSLLLEMVADPDLEVRVRVLSVLARAGQFYDLPAAVEALDTLLAADKAHQRARAIYLLGKIGNERAVRRLFDYLADAADEVRLEAALAVESLAHDRLWPYSAELVEPVHALLRDPVERVRQAAVTILARLGAEPAHRAIITALTDPSLPLRQQAADALAQAGRSVIPLIHPLLDSPRPLLRKMATVILSRVDRREFGPLINSQITGSLLAIYQNQGILAALAGYGDYPSLAVLRSAVREKNDQILDDIFFLLAANHGTEAVKIVADSLRSESDYVRANAAEALETLTSPQTAQLIAPLFEPNLPVDELARLSQATWAMKPPQPGEVLRRMATDLEDPWWRAIMIFVLGEMGAALAPQEAAQGNHWFTKPEEKPVIPPVEPVTEEVKPETKRPRRRTAALLDALVTPETDPEEPPKPPSKEERRRRALSLWEELGTTDEQDSEKEQPARRRSLDILGALTDQGKTAAEPAQPPVTTPAIQPPLAMSEIENLLDDAFADRHIEVRLAARAAHRLIAGVQITEIVEEEISLLSTIEKIIFLKKVPFFESMTVEQLRILADVCEEQFFAEDTHIFKEGDPGGTLYMIISGRVGIEQEKRKDSFARLDTLETYAYFGETSLFDNSPRSASAIALQDTLTLRLRREPLIALARQNPNLSLELINVLSERLREANFRVAQLTRTRTRKLQKFYDAIE